MRGVLSLAMAVVLGAGLALGGVIAFFPSLAAPIGLEPSQSQIAASTASLSPTADVQADTNPNQEATSTGVAPAPAVREFQLTVQEGKWEIQPGTVLDAWTYNGQVPGPEIRVTEGDRVRVLVKNELPVPTTIHWHGVELENAMDGVPGVTQQAIPPGEEFVYDFIAKPAGTRMYHSHQDSDVQMELGLYGSLIVEPREPPVVEYDREYTYILDERALDFTPDVALGKTPYPGESRGGVLNYDLFLMNGKAGSAVTPLELGKSERVLLRVINLGNLVHSMHLHGHTMRVVATDGNPVPRDAQWLKDTVTVGPGERVDLEIFAENPGVWMFHCHMPNHSANGMMAMVPYDDVTPVVPMLPIHEGHASAPRGTHTPTPTVRPEPTIAPQAQATATAPLEQPATEEPVAEIPAAEEPTAEEPVAEKPAEEAPAPAATPTPHPPAADPPPPGGQQRLAMGDNFVERTEVRVARGTTVTWVNNGRNTHTIGSLDGSFESPAMVPSTSFAYTFDVPGSYRYICREHYLNGMGGTIIVE